MPMKQSTGNTRKFICAGCRIYWSKNQADGPEKREKQCLLGEVGDEIWGSLQIGREAVSH
jgi:hypothetical protein